MKTNLSFTSVLPLLLIPLATAKTFIHPGILHTQDDLDRMKSMVEAKTDPWYTAWQNMTGDPLASYNYAMEGPMTYATRNATGASPGKSEIASDAVASVLNAISYYITSDVQYAEKAAEILDSWASTLELLNGTDAQLTASLYGPQFVNAAEILRSTYSAWNASSQNAFSDMILNIFYPQASQTTPTATQEYPFEANWGTSGEKAIVAFGVWLNNETMYNQGLSLYTNYTCADLSHSINSFGQNGESGRDQGHTQLGLGNMAELCQTSANQGDTTYWEMLSNRLMVGYEYTAEYNLGNDVEYDAGFYRCDADLLGGPWSVISAVDRGEFSPIYEIAYGYYNGLHNISMPYTKAVLDKVVLETENSFDNIGDQEVYGTLRFRRKSL